MPDLLRPSAGQGLEIVRFETCAGYQRPVSVPGIPRVSVASGIVAACCPSTPAALDCRPGGDITLGTHWAGSAGHLVAEPYGLRADPQARAFIGGWNDCCAPFARAEIAHQLAAKIKTEQFCAWITMRGELIC